LTNEDTDRAISSAVRRDVKLSGVRGLFRVPYSILNYRADFTETQDALRKDVIRKPGGHATVFRVEEEKHLAAKLKNLSGRCFGYTANKIRRAAFVC